MHACMLVEGREEHNQYSRKNTGEFIQMLKDTIFMLAKTLINLRREKKKTRFVVLFQQMMR